MVQKDEAEEIASFDINPEYGVDDYNYYQDGGRNYAKDKNPEYGIDDYNYYHYVKDNNLYYDDWQNQTGRLGTKEIYFLIVEYIL